MDLSPKQSTRQREVVDFSFQEFLTVCLRRWYWFIISLVICLGVASFYIYRKQPVFERSEEILLTDQDSSGGMGDVANAFSTMGLFSRSSNVSNELISLKSPAIMLEVVQRLSLDMNYLAKDGFMKWKVLYGSDLPIKVDFVDITRQQGAGFRLELYPEGGGRMWKFYKQIPGGKEKFSEEITFEKGQTDVTTPLGKVRIFSNPDYKGLPISENLVMKVNKTGLQATVEHYGNELNGDLVDQDADVITLSIKDVSVQRAVDILNTVLAVYNENWVEDKNKLAVATSTFINERLNVIEQELGDVDAAIAKYQTSTGTTDLASSAYQSMQKESELEAQIVSLTTQIELAEYVGTFLEDSKNKYAIVPVNVGIGNEDIEGQIQSYNSTLMARNSLASNSSDSNPLVSNYDLQLDGLRIAINKGIRNYIDRMKAILSATKGQYAKTQKKIETTPMKSLPLLSDGRQQKVKESLYLYLLQKREENELTQTFTAYNTRVITPPMGSLEPVAPRKKLIFASAFILGLAFPFLLLYMKETNNTKVNARKDLDEVSMPFSGEIPQVGKKMKFKKNIGKSKIDIHKEKAPISVVKPNQRDVVNEAFRVVRSNIEFMTGKKMEGQVIMFTSFNAGSGKSFISYNLALSFALKGEKVLLIDCDLRHGSSSMYVGLPPKGLTNYLNDASSNWENLIVKSPANPNLAILPIGKMPPNPAELLENGRFGELVDELRKHYDYIFLDCPPVNIVVDTQIVAPYADRTLFVVRAGLFDKSGVKDLNDIYESKRFKHMSLILNGTEATHNKYYNSSYHSYVDANT